VSGLSTEKPERHSIFNYDSECGEFYSVLVDRLAGKMEVELQKAC